MMIVFGPKIVEKDEGKNICKNHKIHLLFLPDIKAGFLPNEDLRKYGNP